MIRSRSLMLVGALALITGAPGVAMAQRGSLDAQAAGSAATNLNRMMKPITIEFQDARLEDVMKFLAEFTGAELEVLWTDDRIEGLDPELMINYRAKRQRALTVLEGVLQKAQDGFIENGWQITSYGAIEIGPKSLLNRRKRVVIYDINDLLLEVPNFPDAPQIDLQSVLDQGEGGGQSPFDDAGEDGDEEDRKTREEKIEELIELLTTIVEPEQWVDNGGEGGTIREFQGSLIIQAPDYMHRQLSGYKFWPKYTMRGATHKGKPRRYVSLGTDQSLGTVDDFGQYPVTGVAGGGAGGVGGGGAGAGAGGGGGSNTQPASSGGSSDGGKDKPADG